MMNKSKEKSSSWKRTLTEWAGIGALFALLYFTGLHTEVIGAMQRAILWTGFFDAETTAVQTIDGPQLSAADYQFMMATPEGETVTLSDFKDDVIFINLWASWCPPCIAEMPTIETLHSKVADNEDIHFVMLSMDQKQEKANNYINGEDFSFSHYFPASSLPQTFRSDYLPTTYVISKEGEIVFSHEGLGDYSSPEFRK